jgi:acyl carrier protein
MTDTVVWLIDWFRNRAGEGARLDSPAVNYFEAGLIDSFGVMELVAAVEERFAVRFTADHFQDRRFVTVAGLAELIDDLRSHSGGAHV